MRAVTVQFFKYPDHLHWGHEGFFLGEDDYGTWMGSPVGSRRWKGEEEFEPVDSTFVMCAPHDGWWHLYYNGAGARSLTHFIDITTQPIWVSESLLEMVDLDLDVVMRSDGSIEIDDEDEFAEHQVFYGYSDEMIARAVEETDKIFAALQAHQEPFFDVAEDWLLRARQLSTHQ